MPSSNRKVGAIVALDGEKEYKQALQELNTGNRTLASEMRKLQAEYKGQTNSTEYLTKEGELLNRQLLQQQDKVKKLREAVQQMAQQYGEADERTQRYIQQLNNAEAEEYNLQHSIDENTKALEGQGEEMTGLGDTVEQLADKLGIRIPKGAKDALNGMQSFSAGSVAALTAVAAGVAAAVKGIKELHQMTLDIASEVDELVTQSIVTGIDTQTYQALQYAENLVDVSVSTMTGSLTKLMQNMRAARDGNEEMAASFRDLGIEITNSDGTLRESYDVMLEVIDALGQMEAGTERDATATQILGKSAQELNPLINAGSKALAEYGEQAEKTGYILNESQIKKLAEVDDAYQEVQLTIDALKKQMAADFAPAVKDAMELFRDVVQKAGEMLERSGLIENLAMIIQNLIQIIRSGGEILAGIPGLNQALDVLKVTLGAVAQFTAVIADAADLIKSVLSLDFTGVKNALGFGYSSGYANNYQRTRMQQEGRLDQYDAYYGRNASGTENWRGGLTWVGEAGPELVALPQGSRIYSNQESQNMGGDTFYITIDAKSVKEFNDIVELAKNARVRQRMR